MKAFKLTNEEVAGRCAALAHLFRAGIGAGDAFALLAEDEPDPSRREMLQTMGRQADEGLPLSQVFQSCPPFPAYVGSLLAVGEQVGRTEETMQALGQYYEGRARMDRRVRDALLYPAVLLLILLAVVVILLVYVLPVFNDVYAQLGASLTGAAGALLALGVLLRRLMPVLCLLMAALAVFLAVYALSPALREGITALWLRRRGGKGTTGKVYLARFAQALAMALRSGLTGQQAVELAAELTREVPELQQRCQSCLAALDGGDTLPQALRKSALLPPAQCRLLEAGIHSGSGEDAMEQIAQRLLEDSELALEAQVSRVEPTLVVLMSGMVGVILLSVMLPLMHIMAGIG